MKRAIWTAVVAFLVFLAALLLENAYITDPDLRYPIALLTRMLGVIIVLLLSIRVALVFTREKVRAVAPKAEEGLRAVGTVSVITAFSLTGCIFGVSLMVDGSGSIQLWPLGIVLIFGALGAYCTSYLRRTWKEFQRLKEKPSNLR